MSVEVILQSCPECEENIEIETTAMLGELIICDACCVDLEIVSTSPIQLELAPEIEEDWGE